MPEPARVRGGRVGVVVALPATAGGEQKRRGGDGEGGGH